MTNQQPYLSIGIPTFTVILALLIALFQNNRTNDRIDKLIDSTDRKIDKLSDKIDRLTDKIDRFGEQHHKDFLALMAEMVHLNDRIAKVEAR